MSGRRLVTIVVAAACVVVGTGAHAGAGNWLPWDHWGLELYLGGVQSGPAADLLTFELRLRRGTDRAAVSVGYPRYRGGGLRWNDAVTGGEFPRDRMLRIDRADAANHGSFVVQVPKGAVELLLPLDGEEVRVDLREARAGLATEPAPRVTPTPRPAVAPRRPAPGRPVTLSTDIRWPEAAPFGDGALDAGDRGDLLVDVTNDGARTTWDVRVQLGPASVPGIEYPAEVRLPRIDPGETATARFPFSADAAVGDGTLRLTVKALEEFGHDAPPLELELVTRSAPLPQLELLDDFAVEGAGLPVPRDAVVTVRLRVRNVGHGDAGNVVADVVPGAGVFRAADSPVGFELGDLAPGEVAEIAYRCYANRRAAELGLRVVLFEDRSRSRPASHEVSIPLEGAVEPRVVRVRAEPREEVTLAPPPAPLLSSVDRSLPREGLERPQGLAVVFGVERYATAPPAAWSAADARTAGRYFERVLGIPRHRIQLLVDAEVTLAQFQRIFAPGGWLERRARDDSEIFVFFAGHGIAANDERTPFLVPADGDTNYVEQTGFELGALLERLAALDAARATVFLDACFSGLTRAGEALMASARPMVLVPAHDHVPGVSVFAAASGSQVAGALDEEGHGLFSYYLFRGLGGEADANGDDRLTAGELRSYLEGTVAIAAERADREQRPSVYLDSAEEVLVSW